MWYSIYIYTKGRDQPAAKIVEYYTIQCLTRNLVVPSSQTPINKKDNTDSAIVPTIDSCKETAADDKNKVPKNEVTIGPSNNCARGSPTEQRENLKEKSNEMKQHSSVQHNARVNIENNTDDRPTMVVSIGVSNEAAISKVSIQEQTQQQQEEEQFQRMHQHQSYVRLFQMQLTSHHQDCDLSFVEG